MKYPVSSRIVGLRLSSSLSKWARKRRRDGSGRHHFSRRRAGDGDQENLLIVLGGGTILSYFFIPIESLLSLREGCLKECCRHSRVYKAAVGMTCFCWKDSVFLMGGIDSDWLGRTSLSRDLMRLQIRPPMLNSKRKGSSASKRSPMNSGKVFPVVLVHQGIVYVLSQSASSLHRTVDSDSETDYPIRTFESYNPETDKWDILDTPPFFDRHCEHSSGTLTYLAYVALDNKICISVGGSASYAYDVNCKKWEPCTLFGGSAFGFYGKAIVVEGGEDKYLICTSDRGIVAYAIFDGRVVGQQILLPFPKLSGDDVTFQALVVLGQDRYCLNFTEDYRGSCWLTLVIFQASPKKGSDKYFDARFCHQCRIKIMDDDKDHGWGSVFAERFLA